MSGKLKPYFPVIRERNEIFAEIMQSAPLRNTFESWSKEHQEEFLDFCSGARGLKILYDTFFKEILDPSMHQNRLEALISEILDQRVKIVKILPLESPRLADENTLLLMDIVVQLEDGSIVNVEMQKVGYYFPGQRCACYSADLLLRQYKYLKEQSGQSFVYRKLKNVCTIVIFERSPKEFWDFPEHYIHRFSQQSDTGLKLELLQNFHLISLDIFKKRTHNNLIRTPLEAWLSFLSTDEPEQIITLIDAFPEFREIYQDIYDLCCNIERVMQMFSKELLELDRNTVKYMIDDLQEQAEAERQKRAEAERQNKLLLQQIEELKRLLAEAKQKTEV